MIKDITLGQYFPGNSVLHRLDPRMKIVLMILYFVILFMAKSAISYAVVFASTVSLMLLSGVGIRMYLRGLKPLMIIILFTGIINMLYSAGGTELARFWIFTITDLGISHAVKMILRIVLLVFSTTVLTYTTSPVLLAGGLERLLSPLAAIKVPVHEFSMMMTIALRFIPTLLDETDRIMSAQKARGTDFESGNIFRRVKALIPIIIPLFVSAFRRAEELATAMECRCYGISVKNRTHLVSYKLQVRDFVSVAVLGCLLTGIIFINRLIFMGGVI